jgi:hypothetical protein
MLPRSDSCRTAEHPGQRHRGQQRLLHRRLIRYAIPKIARITDYFGEESRTAGPDRTENGGS